MPTVELRFAALNGHVRTARMIATAVSRRAGVPAGAADEIKLAVTEACARAVRVNRRHAPQAPVHVALIDTPDTFTITVADCGRTGDEVAPGPDGGLVTASTLLDLEPEAADPPWWSEPSDDDSAEDSAGFPPGLGLALIEGLVDEVEISRGPDGVGTVVAMTWHTGVDVEAAPYKTAR
ncbi:anti-sigma regulatory factor (Ser/Thr protein kinase) [Frankia torreyi]|uniref:Anti-sigma regulatory factor (Ser/Thr protein kinase) n=1 Tax=Frankia torreyi TaxID=1856 RepID=A0A0D8BKB0_9ACTN|nr:MULTISPECIES: ATP-binding protein [Frankia]KJE24439.1 anti-sigma regulatory factor (Ser/Thr protein kinase) [Frankia torreyi]KQC38397.1 anti-sigma factor [Frankia sp. ACN1ag]KQM06307.1 anti-sigma regulatory factor (Ser/Thr protein kinase) [Frankia sp. CpI1-P]